MRSAILDDNVMQSCLDFLLEIYNVTKKSKYKKAFEDGFDCLKDIEKPQGVMMPMGFSVLSSPISFMV